mgnify:CR=1 FL=1
MIPIKNYFTQKYGDVKEKASKDTSIIKTKQKGYDFESVQDYYDNRNENFIVGIIDKNISKLSTESDDLFKIRPPLKKSASKKRGVGIYSLKGAVCSTSKEKKYLINLSNQKKIQRTFMAIFMVLPFLLGVSELQL